MKVYHNANCSKSCGVIALLEQLGEKVEVAEYLENPLTKTELIELLDSLNIRAIELIRTSEKFFHEKYSSAELSENDCLNILVSYPQLMQRPIVVNKNRAVIARPVEKVLELLNRHEKNATSVTNRD